MSDRIALNEATYGPIIAKIAGTDYVPKVSINFARVVNDEFLGGVLFSNYTGESIQLHTGSVTPMWINRDLLFVTFDYPFVQLGVNRIFANSPADNARAIQFIENIGFRRVVEIPGVYPGNVSSVVLKMERNQCRFLNIVPRTLEAAPSFH